MLKIEVLWDEEKQAGSLDFKSEDINTWDFVVMLLEDALSKAKFQQNLGRMSLVQQQAMQAAQDQALKGAILRGGLGNGHN